jgi:TPR repeat protein
VDRKSISRYLIGIGDPELSLVFPQVMLLGLDLDRDEEIIRRWCENGAKSGDQLTILAYAKFMALGFIGAMDKTGAISVVEKYASPDYLPSAYLRACLYFDLDPSNVDTVDLSASQMQHLAEKKYPPAVCALAFSMMDSGTDLVGSRELLHEAACLGAPDAMYLLAQECLESSGIDEVSRGIDLLKRASEKNYSAACAALSIIYEYGKHGIEIDHQKASYYDEIYQRLSPALDVDT